MIELAATLFVVWFAWKVFCFCAEVVIAIFGW